MLTMDCPNSIAPTDEELLSFALDGEILPDAARTHLEQCATCQRRLARCKQANAYLISQLYRSQCPTGEQISLYCAGLLPGDERMSIANHVLDCPLCAAEVEATRRFLQVQDIELPSPSLSPRRLVRRIFAGRVVHPQLQLAVRGDASETTWLRQFKARSVDLSLHLSHTSSREHMLLGILTSTDPAESIDALEGAPVELYAAPLDVNGDKRTTPPLLRTQVDDMGDIVFKPVPPGEYSLIIYLPNREIAIDGLTIE
jgi:hypothetical protein